MQIQAYNAASQPSTQFNPARNATSPATATSFNSPSYSSALATNKAANQDQVSLSNAGRALAEQGQDALENGAKILGDLTLQTLSSLGLSSKAEALGAKIEFDSFSYRAKSSTSLSASQSYYQSAGGYQVASSLQFHDEQQTELIGRGRITTADGRSFEFESQLQLSQTTDFSQSSVSQGNINRADAAPPPNRFARQAPSQADTNTAQNVFALRGSAQTVLSSSALFSAIEDILNKIAAGNTSGNAANTDKQVLDPIKDLLSKVFDKPGEKVAPPALERAGAGVAVGELNPNAIPQGIAVGEPDPSSRSSTTNPGIAVGEPNPNASEKTSRGADLFNTKQLQEGAARIARQLEQFSNSPATTSQLATAA